MRNWRINPLISLVLGLLGFIAGVGPARADLDIDLGAALRIDDDTEVFIAVSSRYFHRDEDIVVKWRERYDDSDDCTVALYLSRQSGKAPQKIFEMRKEGLSWWEIGLRLDIPVEAWFLAVPGDPGPPYGNAYGHWRKHQKNPKHNMVLTDAEIRDLVSVRMIHEYYGIDVSAAMEWRASNNDIQSLMAKEYRKRHGPKSKTAVGTVNNTSKEKPGKSESSGKNSHK